MAVHLTVPLWVYTQSFKSRRQLNRSSYVNTDSSSSSNSRVGGKATCEGPLTNGENSAHLGGQHRCLKDSVQSKRGQVSCDPARSGALVSRGGEDGRSCGAGEEFRCAEGCSAGPALLLNCTGGKNGQNMHFVRYVLPQQIKNSHNGGIWGKWATMANEFWISF